MYEAEFKVNEFKKVAIESVAPKPSSFKRAGGLAKAIIPFLHKLMSCKRNIRR